MNKKCVFVLFAGWLCLPAMAAPPNSSLENELESKINTWLESIAQEQKKPSFRSTSEVKNFQFKEIADMGPIVLPLIINKIRERDSAGHLGLLVSAISKTNIASYFDEHTKRYIFPDYPDFSYTPLAFRKGNEKFMNIWVYWWTNGRSKTPGLFDKKYKEWKLAQKENNPALIANKLLDIQNLGIVALPEIISKITAGEKDIIPVFSYLIDNKVSAAASAEECYKWWESNKRRYEMVLNYYK